MSIEAYETKFYTLFWYATQLLTFVDESIHLYFNGLNYDLKVFFVHMTSARKEFNKAFDYMKKLDKVTYEGWDNISANKSQNIGNFSGF